MSSSGLEEYIFMVVDAFAWHALDRGMEFLSNVVSLVEGDMVVVVLQLGEFL